MKFHVLLGNPIFSAKKTASIFEYVLLRVCFHVFFKNNTKHLEPFPRKVPDAPAEFTKEDLVLRHILSDFYLTYRADNRANVNNIVRKYRGRNVSNLWAQLALKYQIPPPDAVTFLARCLYTSAPFEYDDQDLS